MYPPEGIIEIEGKRYEWRRVDCICGLYEMEEPTQPETVPVEGPPEQGSVRDTCSTYGIYLDEPSSSSG